MAADTQTSDLVANDRSVFKPYPQGTLGVRTAEFEVLSGNVLEVNDVIQMIPVKDGETVYDVILQTDDLDDGAALVLDVGDGDVADRYIDGSDVGQAGGIARIASGSVPSATEFPKTYTSADTIDVTVATGPGTGAAGTIRVIAFIG